MLKVNIGDDDTVRYKSVKDLPNGIYLGHMDCLGGGKRLITVCNKAYNVFSPDGSLQFSGSMPEYGTEVGNVTIVKALTKEDWE